jgi:MinD superfamily P-loop ATPase
MGTSMKIAVASGKGGTGKTMVAANLAFVISQSCDVTLVDCDVEEPNLHLFFPEAAASTKVTVLVPAFNFQSCDHCGTCAEFCRYGAITVLPERILFFPELCHSCGGCVLVCPKDAIHEEPERVGQVRITHPSSRLTLITGILDEEKPHATPVIRAAKDMSSNVEIVIFDAAPGTACPVIETLDGCDACILVTESTPFGLHDLNLAAAVADRLVVPSGVVINRSDGQDKKTLEFCATHELPVLMTIPFDRWIAAVQNRGDLISRQSPAWEEQFAELYIQCRNLIRESQ